MKFFHISFFIFFPLNLHLKVFTTPILLTYNLTKRFVQKMLFNTEHKFLVYCYRFTVNVVFVSKSIYVVSYFFLSVRFSVCLFVRLAALFWLLLLLSVFLSRSGLICLLLRSYGQCVLVNIYS